MKEGAKIYDLQDPTSKMSKSAESLNGLIEILDTPEANTKKIKSAVTDTGREVKFDTADKPGISNLLTIFSTLSGRSVATLEAEFEGKGYGDFKGAVAEAVVEYLRPVRTKTLELLEEKAHLESILKVGAEKAEAVAAKTISDVYERIGLVARG